MEGIEDLMDGIDTAEPAAAPAARRRETMVWEPLEGEGTSVLFLERVLTDSLGAERLQHRAVVRGVRRAKEQAADAGDGQCRAQASVHRTSGPTQTLAYTGAASLWCCRGSKC